MVIEESVTTDPVSEGTGHSGIPERSEGREPIAIVGIGCRFPGGADGPDAYWHLLANGVDATSEVPSDRWDTRTFYDPNPATPGKSRTYRGGFLRQIDRFDARFFGISPREAACLDPQQRLLLEVAWEALENAGEIPEHLAGEKVGVFMGAFTLDYKLLQFNGASRDLLEAHTATGSVMTMVANRLSYAFDFRGPSVAVDTACSSSLVAVHLACNSLWEGESRVALAGGVNVMIGPDFTIAESKGGFLSPDGRCKTFDASANGYARGEGAGVVILKPLSRALADGDRIYALIRGTAVNQDGRTNGITVPSSASQEALMREVYAKAGVAPADVQYVEAHGTGTPVGDPLEASAIGAVLGDGREPDRPCIVGSVKTNIGHLEAAAGMAGLIKAALALQHRQIPPHLNLQTPNPDIPFDALNLRVPAELEPWPITTGPAHAGINSFGFGGTNAHVVLEEAPQPAPIAVGATDSGLSLVPLSARSPEALRAAAGALREWIQDESNAAVPLETVASTASTRRSHHDTRLAVVAHSREELAEQLDAHTRDELRTGVASGRVPAGGPDRTAFVFSGMGPQWWAMGRQLLEQEPVFRAALERCDAALRPYTGWSLLEEMMRDEETSLMGDTDVAQPANFALQVALTELWRSWGIEPDAIVGHSAGEVAAAYVAGALTWDDAIRVIFHRSRLQHMTTGLGKMVAVGLSLEEARQLIAGHEERVSIAAINSPSAVTLVGDGESLEAVVQPLLERGIFCRFLKVKVPYHSHYMNPLKEELLSVLDGLTPRKATIPLYSTVTGTRIQGEEILADYWWRNVREPVYFAAATNALIEDGYGTFVELAPHPVLASSVTECLAAAGRQGTVVSSLRRNEEERAIMLGALGALYTLGYPVAWTALYPNAAPVVRLPTYQWQRERYWIESEDSRRARLGEQDHPLLGRRAAAPQPTWRLNLNKQRLPYLLDHRIQGAPLVPGAAYVEMALAAASEVFGKGRYVLEDIEFRSALFIPEADEPTLHMTLDPRLAAFEVYSQPKGTEQPWTLHATVQLQHA